jgi:hypothetical protein
VQLRHVCSLPGEAYVARSAWREASLDRCPRHPGGGCGLVRHGTYRRATPEGMRIARYYCPTARETFSLLPDCLASHFPGELDAIEHVVATVEASRSVEAAADDLRQDITLASAVRWVRRRLTPVRLALITVATLWPEAVVSPPRVSRLRRTLTTTSALVALRTHVAAHLAILPTPLGFHPHGRGRDGTTSPRPHRMGADRAGPAG